MLRYKQMLCNQFKSYVCLHTRRYTESLFQRERHATELGEYNIEA